MFNDTATTEIFTLSLHGALPFCVRTPGGLWPSRPGRRSSIFPRSEEHTSELQSLRHLVCRLLLEKKHNLRSIQVSPAFRAFAVGVRASGNRKAEQGIGG